MANRNYTQKTKERLLKQVKEVDSDMGSLGDSITDTLLVITKVLHLLDIYKSISSTKSYHKAVIDMNDMTKGKINEIFEEVHNIDESYESKYSTLVERNETYNQKLRKLSDLINPNFQIASAKSISEAVKPFNDKLAAVDGKMNEDLDEILPDLLLQKEKEGIKTAVKRIVTGGIHAYSVLPNMIKGMYTEGPAGVWKVGIKSGWELYNDIYGIGNALAGVVVVGFGSAAGLFGNRAIANKAAIEADKLLKSQKVSDAEDAPKWVKEAAGYIDTGMDAWDVYDGITGLPKKFKEYKRFGFSKYKDLSYADWNEWNDFDFKNNPDPYQLERLYEEYQKPLTKIKNAKTAADIVDDAVDSWGNQAKGEENAISKDNWWEVSKEILENDWVKSWQPAKVIDDVLNFADDVQDRFDFFLS